MASPAAVRAAPAAGSPTNPLAQLGQGLWRLLTSVDFAVVQIIFLSILAVIGMTLQQLPDFAFRSPGDYATAMDEIRARYDPVLGPAAVGVLERLGAFAIFKSAIFGMALVVLVISIIVCTLDRTPRLWRDVSSIRVAQPEPFFDPSLPDRAAMSGVGAAGRRARRARARVPGARGDRRRRHAPRLRRSPPVHEDGDALHPPRADPVPRRRGRDLALRRRAGTGRPGRARR